MLELRHLRSLVAIAEHKSLTHAANQLHLTASALSHQLKALEAHYQMSLFQRHPSGLQLTAAGERLLNLATITLCQIQDAERDLTRLKETAHGELRIALECHTCFDWLMPVMDEFRRRWPEIEVDLVAGFHSDPKTLLQQGKADLVIGSATLSKNCVQQALFRFEILLVLPLQHKLSSKRFIQAQDLEGETLITYPVDETRIDLIREILQPASLTLPRRTAELTIAILQLVASRRGIAALPNWGIKNYVDHDYVQCKRIGNNGLWSELYAITPPELAERPYLREFVHIIRERCQSLLVGIELL